MTKFLLLLGPSGAGKSTIIDQLRLLDSRYVYISPFMTRELRDGEKDKIFIDLKSFSLLERKKKFIFINELYGVRYGTPRDLIQETLKHGQFPVLDWPYDRVAVVREFFPVFSCYLYPSSRKELEYRISIDGRGRQGGRLEKSLAEYDKLQDMRYRESLDFDVFLFSKRDSSRDLAHKIDSLYKTNCEIALR